ncbi:hypothetical protein Hanom_Chr09g00870731 [Helianthus anomalus]
MNFNASLCFSSINFLNLAFICNFVFWVFDLSRNLASVHDIVVFNWGFHESNWFW